MIQLDSVKMTEESEDDNIHHSQCRPHLRRSRTITVSGIGVHIPKPDDYEGNFMCICVNLLSSGMNFHREKKVKISRPTIKIILVMLSETYIIPTFFIWPNQTFSF